MDWLFDLSGWTIAGIGALLLSGFASLAERRRTNRKDIEKVGFMPWPMIMVLSLLAGVICFSFAVLGV